MYVRANMLSADPAKLDTGKTFVQEQVVPALESIPGYRGIAMSANRDTGRGAVVTFWEDLDSLRASEERVAPMRDEGANQLGGTLTPQVMEVLVRHIVHDPQPGCWNRVSTVSIGPDDFDRTVEVFRSSTIPALEAMDGFCAAVLSVNRDEGRGVAVTTWRDHDCLEHSRERADTLRKEVTDKAHGTVESVDEAEVLLSMRHG